MAGKSQGSSERYRREVGHRYASKVRAHVQGKNEAYKRIQVLFDQAMEIYANGLPADFNKDVAMTPPSSNAKKLVWTIRRVEDTESNDDDKSRSFSENHTELSSCDSSDCLKSVSEAEPVSSTSEVPLTANTPPSDLGSKLKPDHSADFIPLDKAFIPSSHLSQTPDLSGPAFFIPKSSPPASYHSEQFNRDYQHGRLPSENQRTASTPKISTISTSITGANAPKISTTSTSTTGANAPNRPQHPKSSLNNSHQGKEDIESRLKFLQTFFQVSPSKSFLSPSRDQRTKGLSGELNSSPQSSMNRTAQDHHIFRITKPHLAQKTQKSSILVSSKLKNAPPKSLLKSPQFSAKSAPKPEVNRTSGPRPFSAPKVPFYERFDLTVPIPFDLTPSHRKNKHSQEVTKPTRIHTHPVPLTSQLPLYDPEWEEAERQKRWQARMEKIFSQQRPFHLHSSPNPSNLHKATSMPNL